ncbi:MAG: hypothetical protein KDD46_05915 [Bdellovibrionales bacterium]|nr:hypothetical protein [Bdellovibrionales bacterium]
MKKLISTLICSILISTNVWSQVFSYEQLYQMIGASTCLETTDYRDDLLRNMRVLKAVKKEEFPNQLGADKFLPKLETAHASYFSADFLQEVQDTTEGIYYGVIAENPKLTVTGCDHWVCSQDAHTKITIPIHIFAVYNFKVDHELAKKAHPLGDTKMMDSYIFNPVYFPCTIEMYSK